MLQPEDVRTMRSTADLVVVGEAAVDDPACSTGGGGYIMRWKVGKKATFITLPSST